MDDSARLQETYPGGNAEQISQQQALVVENWGILQEKASHRREDLQAALEMFRFLAAVGCGYSCMSELLNQKANYDLSKMINIFI